jgi:hypothetical protein
MQERAGPVVVVVRAVLAGLGLQVRAMLVAPEVRQVFSLMLLAVVVARGL